MTCLRFGVEDEIDADSGTIKLVEPAVSVPGSDPLPDPELQWQGQSSGDVTISTFCEDPDEKKGRPEGRLVYGRYFLTLGLEPE